MRHRRSQGVTLLLALGMALMAALPAFADESSGRAAADSSPAERAVADAGERADGPAPLLGEDAPEAIEGRYIVVFDPDASSADAAAGLEKAQALGGEVHHTYDTALNGFSATLPDRALLGLREHPGVRHIEADAEVETQWATQSPAGWNLDRIDQRDQPLDDRFVYQATGDGVNAYIIDTGIHRTHNEFGGRAFHAFTSINDGNGSNDCNGHGTHVAGIVGGEEHGVAKEISLHAVRVLDCNGSGTFSGVIAGVDWVTANHTKPAVANMSLGGIASTSLDNAVENSIAAGVTYTVASGSSNADACNYSPSGVGPALTVAASTQDDSAASFSNWGPCVDLYAPGQNITAAWNTSDSATNTLSGTSMAAPHVAGVAALHLEDNPSDSPKAVGNVILATATSGELSNVPPDTPNLLVFSRLHDGHCAYDEDYTGTLPSPGHSVFEPNGGSYYAGSGWHHGCVIAPEGSDVELRLLRWDGSTWKTVAKNTNSGAVQDVSANVPAGYFTWQITTRWGWGDYRFTLSRP